MTVDELIGRVRRIELDDAAAPYLWADLDLIAFAVEAEGEAADRASLLLDSTTAEICNIDITAGEAVYPLDARVLRIKRAQIEGARVLGYTTVRELDEHNPAWGNDSGVPRMLVLDYQTGSIRLYPRPDESATLKLQVVRLPLEDVAAGSEFEIHARYHADLRHWIVKRAFELRNTDAEDLPRAERAEQKFIAAFGQKLPANIKEFNARNYPFDNLDGSN